jgi:hypothetical protein
MLVKINKYEIYRRRKIVLFKQSFFKRYFLFLKDT